MARKLLTVVGCLSLAYFSSEILFARAAGKIPSQVPGWLTYVVLAVNAAVLTAIIRRATTKTEKS